jgi:murein DD-endopeptidase MepM/ murein hydrolase activator NlpD
MMYRPYPKPRPRTSLPALLIVFLVVLVVTAFGVTYTRWEGQAPEVTLNRDFKALGRNPALAVTVRDAGTGLRHVMIRVKQKDQDIALADEQLSNDPSKSYDVGKLLAEKHKVQDGPASLSITAIDASLRGFLRGNRTDFTKDFVFDTQPPRLEVVEGQHYINQGGSECVVYRVSGDAEQSGVQVGSHFFPGFPVRGSTDKNLRFALFAFEYDWPADTPMNVFARDAAGNEVRADFWHKVFPKSFRSRQIPLEDSFVHKVVPEILGRAPDIKDQGDPIKTFVEINSNLRRKNHAAIAKLAAESAEQFLWNGPFLQLSNSKVESFFADRRTYIYQGKAVDQQDHVGFDLSVVERNPIEAANDGKVVLAQYFGIYGNAVLIDHGAGLISLYGHMSEIAVKPGQMVKKKEVLGKSGTTGLAAGDHLHFGLFLHGVPVNATEWWDEKWIKDHILDRMLPMERFGPIGENAK